MMIADGLIAAVGGYHYVNNSDEEFISIGIGVYGTVVVGVVGLVGALIARQNPIVRAVTPAAPAGWYRDPTGRPSALRYWDGTTWTEHTAETER